jgi:hypothetical protein
MGWIPPQQNEQNFGKHTYFHFLADLLFLAKLGIIRKMYWKWQELLIQSHNS